MKSYLNNPLHLKCADTLHCDLWLSLFSDLTMSQGSVVTHFRWDGIFIDKWCYCCNISFKCYIFVTKNQTKQTQVYKSLSLYKEAKGNAGMRVSCNFVNMYMTGYRIYVYMHAHIPTTRGRWQSIERGLRRLISLHLAHCHHHPSQQQHPASNPASGMA